VQPAEGIAPKSPFPAMPCLVVLINNLAGGGPETAAPHLVRFEILTHAAAS
jgi:hypothetical protein